MTLYSTLFVEPLLSRITWAYDLIDCLALGVAIVATNDAYFITLISQGVSFPIEYKIIETYKLDLSDLVDYLSRVEEDTRQLVDETR